MNFLILTAACFFTVASAGVLPAAHYAAPAIAVRPHIPHSSYRAQDTVGQYKYGFVSADGIQRSETRGADGSVIGRYSYVSPEGQVIDIGYSGGAAGFNAAGTGIPIPVADTPEVAAAKSVHYAAHVDAAARAAVDPVGYDGYGYDGYGGYAGYAGYAGYNGLGYGGPIAKYH